MEPWIHFVYSVWQVTLLQTPKAFFHRLDKMSLFSSKIKVIFTIIFTFPLYSETLYLKSAMYRYPTICNLYTHTRKFCTTEYLPVCATNGHTYCNKCLFCLAYKESGGKFNLARYGEC
uniref:Kazal-like domain-containing protein n=1 Tax=Oryctolagus cuniculus TaxID=9986 RepID=A0A5F9D9R9_RABIT